MRLELPAVAGEAAPCQAQKVEVVPSREVVAAAAALLVHQSQVRGGVQGLAAAVPHHGRAVEGEQDPWEGVGVALPSRAWAAGVAQDQRDGVGGVAALRRRHRQGALRQTSGARRAYS